MTILCIETSTSCCSVALAINGKAEFVAGNMHGANHASELPVYIEQVLAQAKDQGRTIDAIALSQGPGSYTGLRIGASTAKGLCYGLNIPLIPIDTLQILCAAAIARCEQTGQTLANKAKLCPMLDARRMEVYTSIYTCECAREKEIEAKIIDEASFIEERKEHDLYFFGNGAQKCQGVITKEKSHWIDDILPDARYMGKLAESQAQHGLDIKQIAYFEPYYLKEFIAAPSHIKGLESK
jgi:tRNA threonylcarbamoyladenosine biosynthesis protein TsaB